MSRRRVMNNELIKTDSKLTKMVELLEDIKSYYNCITCVQKDKQRGGRYKKVQSEFKK